MRRKFILALFFMACGMMAHAGDIYVSPFGNDLHDGTEQRPLKTLQRALRMAREWRRAQDVRAKEDIRI